MDTGRFVLPSDSIVRLRRDLDAYEAERPAIIERVRRRTLPVMGAYTAAAAASIWATWPILTRGFDDFFAIAVLVVIGLAGAGAGIFARQPALLLQSTLRDRLFPLVFGFVEEFRHAIGTKPAFIADFPAELTGSYTKQSFDDSISGRFDGMAFELCEATLSFDATKSVDDTVFRGLILAMSLPRPFPGRFFATRKLGGISKWVRDTFQDNGLATVSSGTPAIDDAYDFRTDNAIVAAGLLAGRLDRALAYVAEAWPGEPARLGLVGARGFLLLPTARGRDLFELPGVDERIDFDRHIAPMIAELGRILSIGRLMARASEIPKTENDGTPDGSDETKVNPP